jgi:hypothetical protein
MRGQENKGPETGFGATATVDFRTIFRPTVNEDQEGAFEVHNPGYDFNDAALPYYPGGKPRKPLRRQSLPPERPRAVAY